MQSGEDPDLLRNKGNLASYVALTAAAMIVIGLAADSGRKADALFTIFSFFAAPACAVVILRRVRPATFVAIAGLSCVATAALAALDAAWYARAFVLIFAVVATLVVFNWTVNTLRVWLASRRDGAG